MSRPTPVIRVLDGYHHLCHHLDMSPLSNLTELTMCGATRCYQSTPFFSNIPPRCLLADSWLGQFTCWVIKWFGPVPWRVQLDCRSFLFLFLYLFSLFFRKTPTILPLIPTKWPPWFNTDWPWSLWFWSASSFLVRSSASSSKFMVISVQVLYPDESPTLSVLISAMRNSPPPPRYSYPLQGSIYWAKRSEPMGSSVHPFPQCLNPLFQSSCAHTSVAGSLYLTVQPHSMHSHSSWFGY
jgi:hypothetical protein